MIVHSFISDGGFIAGDTETLRTSYAYPTSAFACDAKRSPGKVAKEMMDAENCIDGRRYGQTLGYDARNWNKLMEAHGHGKVGAGVTWQDLAEGSESRFAFLTGFIDLSLISEG